MSASSQPSAAQAKTMLAIKLSCLHGATCAKKRQEQLHCVWQRNAKGESTPRVLLSAYLWFSRTEGMDPDSGPYIPRIVLPCSLPFLHSQQTKGKSGSLAQRLCPTRGDWAFAYSLRLFRKLGGSFVGRADGENGIAKGTSLQPSRL